MYPTYLIVLIFLKVTLGHDEPYDAFPRLESNFISDQENIDQLEDLKIYRFGPDSNDRWVLFAHDIYGPNSGRTKEYCQKISDDLGVTCIIPDFFRGASWPIPSPYWDSELKYDWEVLLVPYLKERGAQNVGVMGTCYGSYLTIHTSSDSYGLVKAGVSIHPSHALHMLFGGEDEAAVYSNITSPQYFMVTPDSSNSVRPGGLAQQIIKETHFDEYEDPCIHGFFNRGDLTDPSVAACVDTAMEHLQTFFLENLES